MHTREVVSAPVLVGVEHGSLARDTVWVWGHLLQDLHTDTTPHDGTFYSSSENISTPMLVLLIFRHTPHLKQVSRHKERRVWWLHQTAGQNQS